MDHPGEFPLWFGEKLISNRSIRGEALHALELIAGDEVSSYKVKGKTAPVTVEPKDIWIKEAKQWFSKLFSSEADALVDDFKNNPPPEIGTQSYTGNIHDKGD